jgi:hypothetical protein
MCIDLGKNIGKAKYQLQLEISLFLTMGVRGYNNTHLERNNLGVAIINRP